MVVSLFLGLPCYYDFMIWFFSTWGVFYFLPSQVIEALLPPKLFLLTC